MMTLDFPLFVKKNITDIHMTAGKPALIRSEGLLMPGGWIPSGEDLAFFLQPFLSKEKQTCLIRTGSCDTAFSSGSVRCRLHIYRSGNALSAAVRILPGKTFPEEDPDYPWIQKTARLSSGLVLITGPCGSGKTTSLARIIEEINSSRSCHIITLEDPVEYLFSDRKSLIHQREIGIDVPDFASGVRASLREDPDVLVIGELRDASSIEAALTAAETGHLVLATMHTQRAAETAERIIQALPKEREGSAGNLLSSILRSSVSQRLINIGKKRLLLREILTNNTAVSRLIREKKYEQIPAYMEMNGKNMKTFAVSAEEAVRTFNLSAREQEELKRKAELPAGL